MSQKHRPIVRAFVACAFLFAGTSIYSPGFAHISNINALLTQASLIGLVALGQTLVIIGGGIDLSVPWVLNGSAMLMTLWAQGDDGRLIWVIPLVLVAGAIVGTANGIGVTLLRIPPIIMTLAMMAMVEGGLLVYTGGSAGQTSPPFVDRLASHGVGPFSGVTAIWIAAIVFFSILLTWTVFGRRLYALGNSKTAARFSGVNERTVITTTYSFSGATAAAAGVLLAGYVQQSYLGMGEPYLFTSVAAVAIGGASILGGTGNAVGTMAGALTLSVLSGMLPIFGFSPGVLDIVYGAIILIAVTAAGVTQNPESSTAGPSVLSRWVAFWRRE